MQRQICISISGKMTKSVELENYYQKERLLGNVNSDREKLDLRDVEEKVNAVRKKIGEISDLGDLKSFVKFTKTGVIMNEKRINTLKGLGGGS